MCLKPNATKTKLIWFDLRRRLDDDKRLFTLTFLSYQKASPVALMSISSSNLVFIAWNNEITVGCLHSFLRSSTMFLHRFLRGRRVDIRLTLNSARPIITKKSLQYTANA